MSIPSSLKQQLEDSPGGRTSMTRSRDQCEAERKGDGTGGRNTRRTVKLEAAASGTVRIGAIRTAGIGDKVDRYSSATRREIRSPSMTLLVQYLSYPQLITYIYSMEYLVSW